MTLLRTLYRIAFLARRLDWSIRRPVVVGVVALLVKDDRVLLVWHSYRPRWFFPGGALKRGETLEAAVRREVAEEVGATLKHLELLGIYTSFDEGASNHAVLFVSEDFALVEHRDVEIARRELFPLDALPPDASNGIERRVAEYRQFRQDRRAHFGTW